MRFSEIKEIPLDQLEIGPSQARSRDVGKGIDDLAHSIAKMGLLEPIVVAPVEGGRYEIITGQRRYLAHVKLGRPTIPAQVLAERVSDSMAKAISLTENMMREEMQAKDYIDACTDLYRRYGSIKSVSEELGLPAWRVSQYVKFDQLVVPLQDMVKTGAVDLATALRAQKAAQDNSGSVDAEAAITYAREMKGMSGVQQRMMEKTAAENPGAAVETVIEAARKQPKVKQIVVTISDALDQALVKFATDEGSNKDDAALSLIEGGLTEKGYI